MREEVMVHQEVIHKYLGRYGLVAANEATELEDAYAQLREIQNRCLHQFHRSALFTSDRFVCDYCGLTADIEAE